MSFKRHYHRGGALQLCKDWLHLTNIEDPGHPSSSKAVLEGATGIVNKSQKPRTTGLLLACDSLGLLKIWERRQFLFLCSLTTLKQEALSSLLRPSPETHI